LRLIIIAMTNLLIDLPDDLARWLAQSAASRRTSRQDVVLDILQRAYERSLKIEAIAVRIMNEDSELMRRLAQGLSGERKPELVGTGFK
jgi:hypothetical protein